MDKFMDAQEFLHSFPEERKINHFFSALGRWNTTRMI